MLVQTNFGGILQVLGAPVGRELGQYAFKRDAESPGERGDGSCVMVVATDAPLSDRNLERLAARAIMGLARTGSSASNGSGDYVLAFSTNDKVRRRFDAARLETEELANEQMSGLFEGVGRGDGGSDLQLAVRGDDDDRERPHDRRDSARQGSRGAREVPRRLSADAAGYARWAGHVS